MGITWAAYLIGGLSIFAIGIWIAAEWRGWFKRIPPSQTSEQMEEV